MSLRLSKTLLPLLRPALRTRPTPLPPRPQHVRTYATPTPLPPNIPLPASLLSKLQKSPEIFAQLQVCIKMFQAKGLATEKAPSMMEMAKLAMDKELMGEVKKLAGMMQEEGMMGDLTEVLKGMGMGKGK